MDEGNQPENVVAAILNCIRKNNTLIVIGDLFFGERKLYFVPLSYFLEEKNTFGSRAFGTIMGGVLGGITGAMVGSMLTSGSSGQSNLANAYAGADSKRGHLYGLSLQERINKSEPKSQAIAIPRERVLSLSFLEGSAFTCKTLDGESYSFIGPSNLREYTTIVNVVQGYTGDLSGFVPVDMKELRIGTMTSIPSAVPNESTKRTSEESDKIISQMLDRGQDLEEKAVINELMKHGWTQEEAKRYWETGT